MGFIVRVHVPCALLKFTASGPKNAEVATVPGEGESIAAEYW
jgi:hypothetical protein